MRVLLFLVTISAAALSGCGLLQADNQPPMDLLSSALASAPDSGATALVNGENWKARTVYQFEKSNQLVISFGVYDNDATLDRIPSPYGSLVEYIKFFVPFRGTGTYTLEPAQARHAEGFDDVFGPNHPLLDSADNRLTISSYDPEAGEMIGTFEATFVNTNPYANTSDTLRFTNGTFRARLVRQPK